jgi:hypothetical protein
MAEVKNTKECPLRYAFKTIGADGTPSRRNIFLCKKRYGFMIKHWKCVGLNHDECPLKKI